MVWPRRCTKNKMTNVYKSACYVKSLFPQKFKDMVTIPRKKETRRKLWLTNHRPQINPGYFHINWIHRKEEATLLSGCYSFLGFAIYGLFLEQDRVSGYGIFSSFKTLLYPRFLRLYTLLLFFPPNCHSFSELSNFFRQSHVSNDT